MIINRSSIAGLTLVSLIIAFLVVQDETKEKPYTKSEKLAIAVFSFWCFAIILDIIFSGTYTFTFVRGIKINV